MSEMSGPKDLLGRVVKVGDILAYPMRDGNKAEMRVVLVKELFHPDSWQSKADSTLWGIKGIYLEESSYWAPTLGKAKQELARTRNEVAAIESGNYGVPRTVWKQGSYRRQTEDEVKAEALAMLSYYRKQIVKLEREISRGPKLMTLSANLGNTIIITELYQERQGASEKDAQAFAIQLPLPI